VVVSKKGKFQNLENSAADAEENESSSWVRDFFFLLLDLSQDVGIVSASQRISLGCDAIVLQSRRAQNLC